VHRTATLLACLLLTSAAATIVSAAPAPGAMTLAAPSHAGSDTARVHVGPEGAGTDAFVAWPAGKGPFPAVIVAHEWWGLNAQIRSVARRLAQEGYVAIVPDLYHGQVADDPTFAHELSRGLDEDRAVADLDAARDWLAAQPRVVPGRIGVVGFCMGGRLSELLALHEPAIGAAVMFYGRPETNADRLALLHAPLQAHFGGADRGIGPEQVDALRSGLTRAGKPVDVFVYPGAGHAFMNDVQPSYHADAARQAWARTLQFFQKYLRG
jgi:carboxymethylenebutenolidase